MTKAKIDFYGTSEILQKLEKAGANVEKEIVKALQKSVEKPKNEMLDFVKSHKYSGQTEESFIEEIVNKKGVISLKLGFSVRKGGIAAIFLNLGSPRNPPSFFIEKAIENNIDYIKNEQEKALQQAFKDLV